MPNARLLFLVASTALTLTAGCGGGAASPAPTPPPDITSTGGGSAGGGGGGSSSASGAADSGSSSTGSDGGVSSPSPCTALIGHWLATLDPGAVAMGTDTSITGPIPISGTIDFTLTHDDGDLPDIVDFSGTATISALGQTFMQTIQPAMAASGDPKDTKCDGGLNLHGEANVSGIGDFAFSIVGTLDTTVTPTTGVGTFTMKTADDDGGALSASGTLHITGQ